MCSGGSFAALGKVTSLAAALETRHLMRGFFVKRVGLTCGLIVIAGTAAAQNMTATEFMEQVREVLKSSWTRR